VAEAGEAEECFYCGKETTALIKDVTGEWICGYCFIFDHCVGCGPDDYSEDFVRDMRAGLEGFIRFLESEGGSRRG